MDWVDPGVGLGRDFAVFDWLGCFGSNNKSTIFLMITQHTIARERAI